MVKKLDPVHPGEVLLEEFLVPLELSQNALARGIGVPPRRINEIVHGARRVTADTALRLGRFFGLFQLSHLCLGQGGEKEPFPLVGTSFAVELSPHRFFDGLFPLTLLDENSGEVVPGEGIFQWIR